MTLGQIILVLVLLTISDLIANKVYSLYSVRKVKKLYNNIDCQANCFDINNSMKGE